jgi:hypothetical protein
MPQADRAARKVVLFYPSDSLARQVMAWAGRRAEYAVQSAFVRSFPGMRKAIGRADAVLVDATNDYPQAIDAFSQALGQLGAAATAVYTEQVHEGLELFVRLHGSLLLLGPLSEEQWEGFFERALRASSPNRRLRLVA